MEALKQKAKEYKTRGLDIFAFIHDCNALVNGWTQTRELAAIFAEA